MSESKTTEQKFAAAWQTVKNPEKDTNNPRFNTPFASLGATQAVIREACAANGLAYMQRITVGGDGEQLLTSEVVPTEGEGRLMLSVIRMQPAKDSQAFGSALTYAKRYQAQLDWGITGEAEDDGEAAVKEQRAGAQGGQKRDEPAKAKPISEQLALTAQHLGVTEGAVRITAENHTNGKALEEMDAQQARQIIGRIYKGDIEITEVV